MSVRNGKNPVCVILLDKEGKEVASSNGKEDVLEVKDANLWQTKTAERCRLYA